MNEVIYPKQGEQPPPSRRPLEPQDSLRSREVVAGALASRQHQLDTCSLKQPPHRTPPWECVVPLGEAQ